MGSWGAGLDVLGGLGVWVMNWEAGLGGWTGRTGRAGGGELGAGLDILGVLGVWVLNWEAGLGVWGLHWGAVL